MKFKKIMKRINKAIAEDKHLKFAIVDEETDRDQGIYVLDIEKKNRHAFRFFRDQFSGEEERLIDTVYGQGGHMRVNLNLTDGDEVIGIKLFNSDNNTAGGFTVTQGEVVPLELA